jgi:hypothetical protein
VDTQCRNVWEAATSEVDVLTVVCLGLRTHVGVQVMLNGCFLVPRRLEVIAEATGRARPSDLGFEVNRATDGSDIWACCGEDRVELRCLAILVQTRGTDTSIAGRLKDRHTTRAEDSDQVANANCVLLGDCLLVVSVGIGDDLWQLVVGLREQELVVGQVWLVLVCGTGGLDWVWDVRAARTMSAVFAYIPISCGNSRATSSDEFCDRQRMRDRNNVLHVEVGLSVISIGGRLGQIRRAIFRIDKDD